MINFVIVWPDLWPYVLDIQVKRRAELSADHHLVVSLITWRGRTLHRLGAPKHIVRFAGNAWQRPQSAHLRQSFNIICHLTIFSDIMNKKKNNMIKEYTPLCFHTWVKWTSTPGFANTARVTFRNKTNKTNKTNVYIRFENIGALGGILLYAVIYFQFWQFRSPKLFPTW